MADAHTSYLPAAGHDWALPLYDPIVRLILDCAAAGEGGHGSFTRLLHAGHRLEDNAEERLLTLMRRAGFAVADKVAEGGMLFGYIRLNYYKAS